jgi:hypothetical protein
MTSLELKLASILELIEHARTTKDALALATLLQRKDAICAVLAAPEHSWCHPGEIATAPVAELEIAVALVA